MEHTKKYDVLEPALNYLTKTDISPGEEKLKVYREQLKKLLEEVMLPEMKKTKLFDCLFKRILPGGSFYENLKVGEPNEFDLNLEFELPVSKYEISDHRKPGFVEVKIKSFDENKIKKRFKDFPEGEALMKKEWLDEKNFLHRSKVATWLQKVVDKARTEIERVRGLKIGRAISGPAVTLIVHLPNTDENWKTITFSVDLVPVLAFSENEWPKSMRQPFPNTIEEYKIWCIVPKPPHGEAEETFWRTSFYEQERDFINNKQSMKKALKLIKLLRDRQGWKNLASYYIKTVFMWEIYKQEPNFWEKSSASFIFIYMLKTLMNFLERKEIPFFWQENLNLLTGKSMDEFENIHNRIRKILKNIDNNLDENPNHTLTYFGRKQGLSEAAEEFIKETLSQPCEWGQLEDKCCLEGAPPSPADTNNPENHVNSSPTYLSSLERPQEDPLPSQDNSVDDETEWSPFFKFAAITGALVAAAAGGAYIAHKIKQNEEQKRKEDKNDVFYDL